MAIYVMRHHFDLVLFDKKLGCLSLEKFVFALNDIF